jgi:hypothetical protein
MIAKRCFTILFIIAVFACVNCLAQESEKPEESIEKEERHVVSATFGYTYIGEGAELGASEANGVFVPTFGLDYFHVIDRKWELGIMVDLELDHYLIVEKELERENAFIATLMAVHKLRRTWYLFAGAGIEIEGNKNLAVLRLGMERPLRLRNNWFLGPAIFFDIKEGYDTWSLSIGIGKKF